MVSTTECYNRKKYKYMSCLSIIGKNFDIDSFIKETKLRGFKKVYKGTIINDKRTLTYSYISKEIANYDDDLIMEIQNTLKYLKRHKTQLIKAKNNKEVEYIDLNFFSTSKMEDRSSISHTFYFNTEFLLLCGELGISLEYTHYVNTGHE